MTLLLDVALAATVLFAAAWMATVCLGSASAVVRRTIWRAVFVGVAALPLLMKLEPVESTMRFAAAAELPSAVSAAAQTAARTPWLTVIWAIGCVFVFGRLMVGLSKVRRWGRGATRGDTADFSPAVTVPMTWGVFRPQILLPADAHAWSARARDLVVRHEAAHVASRDWAWQTMARLVTAALWFHPLAWIADRRLRREAERAADDAVIASGANPADYADELVRVARQMLPVSAVTASAVGMVEQSSLEARIRHVLDDRARRGPASWIGRLAVAISVAAVTVSAVAMQEGPIYDVDVVGLKGPAVLKEVKPEYSEEAKKTGIQGKVILETVVEKNGLPNDIRVIQPLEESLDRAAVTALSQWEFVPARLKDEPVRVMVQIEFRFTIK